MNVLAELFRTCLDNRKAKSRLGWRPEVSFDDGLRETYGHIAPRRSEGASLRRDGLWMRIFVPPAGSDKREPIYSSVNHLVPQRQEPVRKGVASK